MVFIHYILKRFPIPLALLFSIIYVLLAFGITNKSVTDNVSLLLSLVCVFFFFLLRLRVTDEFKDKTYDKKYYPDRPFVSGEINEKQLFLLLIISCIGEFTPLIFLRVSAQMMYIVIICYSLLMAQDFFLTDFFANHFTLQFFLHEIIFLFYAIFLLLACDHYVLDTLSEFTVGVGVLYIVPMCIEIIRKFSPRYDVAGNAVSDTYSAVWGRKNTLLTLCILLILSGVMLTLLKKNVFYGLLSFCFSLILFLTPKRTDRFVSLLSGLTLVLYALVSSL